MGGNEVKRYRFMVLLMVAAALISAFDSQGRAQPTYNIQDIGLTGSGYSYSYNGGTYQFSQPDQMNSAGQVIGFSARGTSTGTSEGTDSWFFNGSNTLQMGLTGNGYTYAYDGGMYEVSDPNNIRNQLNNAGDAVGVSDRYNLIPQRYPGRGGMQQRSLPRQIPLAFSIFRPVLVCDTRAAALVL